MVVRLTAIRCCSAVAYGPWMKSRCPVSKPCEKHPICHIGSYSLLGQIIYHVPKPTEIGLAVPLIEMIEVHIEF